MNAPTPRRKVIVEAHVPYVDEYLTPELAQQVEIVRLAPEAITPEAVADAYGLIIRTRTRCNAALLEGSAVRFIATATIGTDHIDLPYCAERGIEVVSCPGCNAPAVAQYVWASVFTLLPTLPQGCTIGIVGLGHVGSIVAEWASRLGVRVLACDPPRARNHGGWDPSNPSAAGNEPFVTLDQIAAEADIITFHTPHTLTGPDATHHLADERFFASLRRRPVVINAARGPVFATEAVLSAVRASQLRGCVIDCWEGEPAISAELLALADIATPHIAGYSIEGKRRATAMTLAALRRHLEAESSSAATGHSAAHQWHRAECESPRSASQHLTPAAILASYDPRIDTAALRANPSSFEALRNHYPLRHEL